MQKYNPEEVKKLADQVVYHKTLYYSGKPEISDVKYDEIEEKLKKISPDHPALMMVGDGGEAVASKKVTHARPMLSLAKTYSYDELISWAKDHEMVATLKLDGNSLSLVYTKGQLNLAKTRGNGKFGEDVTEKVKWVSDCVPDLKSTLNYEVRGELYCDESKFIKLSKDMIAKGLEPPTNPRNTVAGILGRKKHISLARYFSFAAFDVLDENGECPFKTEVEKFHWLKEHGFVLPEFKKINSEKQIADFLEFAKKFMEEDEVGIDGVVFSYDAISLHKELGETSHHPRYKMSFKWQGETAVSTINDIKWATSRLGVVTPVAVIEPVYLSGATITNVTLHNAAHVKLFNLKVGDEIELVRSGEVIPKFLKVTKEGKGECTWPSKCPSCDAKLHFDDVRVVCLNKESCPAQQIGSILNWIRSAAIDDLSEKRLQSILDMSLIQHVSELYELKVEDFLKLPLTKEKMAEKLFKNIQNSRNLPLAHFLNGLGIQGTGVTTWEALLEFYPSLNDLEKAKSEDIEKIDGFAEKSSKQIVDGLKEKKNDIELLLKVGVQPQSFVKVEVPETGLTGKMIVITGTLTRPRGEFESAIKAAGAKMGKTVSKNTDALVIADLNSTSSKAKKAKELNIPLWNEEEFWKRAES